ncbi:MAG: glycosyltransferase [bacterium]
MNTQTRVLIFRGYSPDKYTGKGQYIEYLFRECGKRNHIFHTWNPLNYIHPKSTYLLHGLDIYLLYIPKVLLYVFYYKLILNENPVIVIDSQENLYLVRCLGLFDISPDILIFYDFGSPTGSIRHVGHLLLRCKKIIVMTSIIAKKLIDQLGASIEEKVQIVPYKVPEEWLKQKTQGITLPKKYILYVGSEQDRKNMFVALSAFESLIGKYPDIHFVKVGTHQSQKNRSKLHRLLDQNPKLKSRFILIEDTSDEELQIIYQNAHLLLFPSLYEGFGIPLVEAMAKQLPILATNIPTTQEICLDSAEYIEDTSSSGEWSKKIQRFFDDESYYLTMKKRVISRSSTYIEK